jgi:AraC-like DNA-binding protein
MPTKLHTPVTVPIAFVHGLLAGIRARGEADASVLDAAGIPPALLRDIGARVTVAQYSTLFRLLVDERNDEGLGFLSRPLKPGSFALVARSALGAPDLEHAIHRMAKTFWLLQDDVALGLRRESGLAGLALRFVDRVECADAQSVFLHELLLRTFWRLAAWLVGGRLPAVRFDFAFDYPAHAGSYNRTFPAPLSFAQGESSFWFDEKWLRSPIRRDESALRAFLQNIPVTLLVPPQKVNITSGLVSDYLNRTQPAWPDLAVTAHALHMSVATLQRRLAIEETSFQSLKDELRRDIAIVRLSDSKVTLTNLAQELGFVDSAAFQRAFKRWVGSAPGTYRKQHA